MGISRRTFDKMPRKDTVARNTMILANSMHGHGVEALSLFRGMIGSGIRPNSVTFTGVLSGCSHPRLVDEGHAIFNSMSRDHGDEPDEDHYSYMVDVFSRAGRLEEAYGFIQKMPLEPTTRAWGALLGACRVYKNVELGAIAAKLLFDIEPDNPGNYILLSNILVVAKLRDDASMVRKLMRDRGDKRSVWSDEIYGFLDELGEKMSLMGYVPNTSFALHEVDEEEKEEGLSSHGERLAVAFGILNSNGGSTIRKKIPEEKRKGFFKSFRGLKQGDLLSSFLFVIVVEAYD
ncbi:pentatricopeptide repeat-containing protein CRR2, chloroplastic-like [Magnolia sinica]|uniref:pentatricopeptide repeat-containing protein CRR2, chloroplastic-like n=1 Tax=Magnolia sinica TaxID=86752 RepID=UPI0026580F94|nr:pentatricopeptide repeat-containing protein CRR2, chloroplastic-like [Magnolia sinica]